ncbi:FAD-dependent oxidoreductase [Desulfosporosinus sp.]|uniref:FAD-dependent oxidoreductase n=1 Tax=Desulfosporosinus sp. TaxID=157907 RepID=UPI00232780A1|nr:FAD-dependent oxidoreductase [Desulfosporosinus sp.]MCO5388277.1 FAD-dependent oxidoreductase [Desulfosporosinus sp.]MDA8222044.1 FAD-dependent oxidoreductase [Desulfitobacterium hafniense]
MNQHGFAKFPFVTSPESFWIASTPKSDYPTLNEDMQVDVAIIGGGMVGISSAYLLSEEGLKVAVLEADRILLGTTAHTTAKLTSQHGLIYDQIKRQMGPEKARQYAEANETAIKFVAHLIAEKKIECDFSWQSAYVYTQSDDYIQKLQDEQAVAAELGIKAFYQTELAIPIPIKGALRFDDQVQFHPRKYLLTLAKMIEEKGNKIFEQSRVVDLQGEGPYSVFTRNGKKVTARSVIMASHYPCHNFPGLYFTRLYTERAYAVVAKAKESFPGGMYINAETPTRSLRSLPTEDGERILIVGEKHKTGHGQNLTQHYQNLMDFAQELFTVEEFSYRWSTQDCTSMDDIPYIGQMTSDRPNLYIASGFRKWGMTNSTVSGMILRDLIVQGESPWQEVYHPSRFTSSSAVNFIVQNADVGINFISGKLKSIEDTPSVEPGEAKVTDVKGHRAGVYKDYHNEFHIVDTTCTHMGCEVQWNDAEHSWDCPCHGSRFTVDGKIVEGPAMKELETL